MSVSLDKLVQELNVTLNNPLLAWSPETGYVSGCLALDYYQPGDSKTPYRLQSSLKGGFENISERMSKHDMEMFLKGAIFGANRKKVK